jgi:hypothetical protein
MLDLSRWKVVFHRHPGAGNVVGTCAVGRTRWRMMETDADVVVPRTGRPILTLAGPASQITRQVVFGVLGRGRALPVPPGREELETHRGGNGS